MTTEIFPRKTNSLLSQEEKNFLDDMPDQAVDVLLATATEGQSLELRFIANDLSTTKYYLFEAGDRVTAVKDYYEMLFYYGIRKDPRA